MMPGMFDHLIRAAQESSRELEDSKRAEQLRAEYAAIVESSADAIISKTLDGRIVSWNPGAERLFGYTAAEAIGQPITVLIPPDRVNEERDIIARLARGERLKHFETIRRHKDGRDIHVSLSISPVKDDAGRIVGAAKIARDITERKRTEQALRESEERFKALFNEAETANRLKDEFLATLSHELRTPLNAIYGWVHMARSGILDDAGIDHALETIDRNARIQSKLIEDLLDISRIITGKIRLEFKPVDLCSIIQAAIEVVRLTAENKGIELDVILDPESCPFSGDGDRLQQALWNLLSNAVKFTPKNGRVEVRMIRNESEIDIVVSDTGQGIDPTFLPYVFDRFRQADATPARRHGGLGLGLAIVRYLIELHGGTVHADSAGFGQGSTFTITLPRTTTTQRQPSELPPREPATVSSSEEGPVKLQDLHILVIEDEPDSRLLLVKILEGYGAKVTAVGTVDDAMDTLKQFTPDVLLSDIGLPGEDGYSLIRRVRSLPGKERAVHAIALTAHARTEDRAQAISAGYDEHMAKPFDVPSLLRVISFRSGG